jgi:hypothetical protein
MIIQNSPSSQTALGQLSSLESAKLINIKIDVQMCNELIEFQFTAKATNIDAAGPGVQALPIQNVHSHHCCHSFYQPWHNTRTNVLHFSLSWRHAAPILIHICIVIRPRKEIASFAFTGEKDS